MPKEKGFSLLIIVVGIAILGVLAFFGFKNFNPTELKDNKIPSTPKTESSTDATKLILPKLTYTGAYNGPLYDSSSKMGDSAPIDLHLENMDRNGVSCFIAYVFAQEEEDLTPLREPMKKYPGRIIPFYASGLGGDEAEPFVGDKLTKLFEEGFVLANETLGKDKIVGIGELETFQWSTAHNDPRVLQLFDFATERTNLIALMKDHKNLYYTIDVDHLLYDRSAGTGLLYKYEGKDTAAGKNGFIKDFDSKYQAMLKADLSLYKPLIEAHPDRVTWGTEMNIRYTYEPEVYDRMIKFIRLFIGSLDPSLQEKIGYKNALEGFGEGVKLK